MNVMRTRAVSFVREQQMLLWHENLYDFTFKGFNYESNSFCVRVGHIHHICDTLIIKLHSHNNSPQTAEVPTAGSNFLCLFI